MTSARRLALGGLLRRDPLRSKGRFLKLGMVPETGKSLDVLLWRDTYATSDGALVRRGHGVDLYLSTGRAKRQRLRAEAFKVMPERWRRMAILSAKAARALHESIGRHAMASVISGPEGLEAQARQIGHCAMRKVVDARPAVKDLALGAKDLKTLSALVEHVCATAQRDRTARVLARTLLATDLMAQPDDAQTAARSSFRVPLDEVLAGRITDAAAPSPKACRAIIDVAMGEVR